MKVARVELAMLRVPLRTPFKTALRTVEAVEDVVVVLSTDTGHVGYGEAPPTAVITGDTHESILHAIRDVIGPRLVGADIADLGRVTGLIQDAMPRNTSPKAALEIAVHDLWAQRQGAPLYRALGGSGAGVLRTDITISVDAIDKMVADALAAVARGFTALKVKVGKDIDVDIERVKAVHAAVGGRASLRLDPNQGWTAEQAVFAMGALEAAGVPLELLEQPVKAGDLAGLKYVRERVHAPVMADESVFGPAEALELVRMRAADIINIKLMKAGGLSNAMRIADIARQHGIECMIGCMLESSISVAAAVHLALANPDVITRVDLDGPSLCAFDPVDGGVRFDDADISVSEAPGLGIRAVRGLEFLPD